MKWFKHFVSMSDDPKIQELEGKHGLVGYAFYVKVLELCAQQYDGVSDDFVFVFNMVTLQNKLRMKRKRIQNLFRTNSELNFWKAELDDNVIRIKFPKLLEIRHRDAFNASTRQALIKHDAGLDKSKKKNKKKSKKKSGPTPQPGFLVSNKNELIGLFDAKRHKEWLELYPKSGFVGNEALKYIQWLEDNPQRKPDSKRGYKTGFTAWLNRGWRWAVERGDIKPDADLSGITFTGPEGKQ